MDTKEYLEQVYNMNKKIDLKMDKLAMLQEMAVKRTANISATTGGNGNYQKMESNVIKIAALKEEISADIQLLHELEEDVEKTILLLGDERLELILLARYIYIQSWEEIATKMNYSKRYVMTLHKKAFEIVEKRIKFGEI